MGISERVDSMVVRATSPNGSVTATVRGMDSIEVTFMPGFYQEAGTHQMETQLAQVAKVLWANRMREYRAIVDDESNGSLVVKTEPADRRDEQFFEQRENLVAEGSSSDGRVRVTVRGMVDWTVHISPGTLQELREYELATAVGEAAQALIRDQTNKMLELKLSIYEDDEHQ
jgi:DNA-binding protein YbaB